MDWYFPSGAASEWRVWLLEMCKERDPEGRSGGPGGHREPVLSDLAVLDDGSAKNTKDLHHYLEYRCLRYPIVYCLVLVFTMLL